jgi:hypothetical protein
MKDHSRSSMKRGSLGYRTPSTFRFAAHDKARVQQARLMQKFTKKKG